VSGKFGQTVWRRADCERAGATPTLTASTSTLQEITMQTTLTTEPNPFALMMDPQTVLQAMERLDLLTQSARRICRPLDKPLIAKTGDDVSAFDRKVDGEGE
jgi:hypothetical protein